jgi:serine protease Do
MNILLRAIAVLCFASSFAVAQSREEKVRGDKLKIERMGNWIYNDLATGFREAEKSGKPLMVVLRCIPCEECVKLDDELIEQHPAIKNLLTKFVRVRQISTNGLDLALFQYDYDQSFAVFFFNADGTIYGRYGTRSHRTEWKEDVSVEGLANAMRATLDMHRDFSNAREKLAGKKGPNPEFSRPELLSSLKDKFTSELDYNGLVAKSCIHCHQIGDAIKDSHRKRSTQLPLEVLFPYPNPKIIGLNLNPKECATVRSVTSDSEAAESGIQAGDRIREAQGQPLISIADLQFVLHNLPAQATDLELVVSTGNASRTVTMKLPNDWKSRDDISWRASTWELRRWGLGGMFVETCSNEERAKLKVGNSKMALKIRHVGEYAPHDVAKLAGFRNGDILVSVNGKDHFLRETDLLQFALNRLKPGDLTTFELYRDGKKEKIEMRLPPPD